MRLHARGFRDGLADRPLDPLGQLVRVVERQLTGELEVERDLQLRADVSTFTLCTSRTPATASAAACARSRTSAASPGSTWTTTSLTGARDGVLDRIRRGMPLPDRGARGHADDDVRELPVAGLPHPKPAQLDAGSSRSIAARATASASSGTRSMSTSTLPRISLIAARITSTETKSAAIASPTGYPARARSEPDEHGHRAREVAREVERVRPSAALP